MAMEPSPTAEATRFTAPWRTSPAANTPGMLVSSEKRTAIERRCATLRDLGPREDESLLIPFDLRRKPLGVRLGSDQEE